jgi:hypothetical protein
MYATGTSPGTTRESYAGFTPAGGTARADAAQVTPPRLAAAPDDDTITPPGGRIADGADPIPSSPMQGMLAVFGDFLRSAFEQLGQMLAGLVAGGGGAVAAAPGYQTAQAYPGDSGASSPAAEGDGPDPGDDGPPQGAGAQAARPDGAQSDGAQPGGAQSEAGAAHRRRGHAHGRAPAQEHLHRHGRGHGSGYTGGPLRPGQSLDLGDGERIRRTRNGALEITIGGRSAEPFGGRPDPFGGRPDPFGGRPDPFGGEPFGGGTDPFGERGQPPEVESPQLPGGIL